MTMTFASLTKTALKAVTLATLALTAIAAPGTAQAAQCGPRDKMVAHITGKIKASRQALALAGKANMVELYVANSGAWVLTITKPNKATCVFAAGSSWESMPLKVAAGPSV